MTATRVALPTGVGTGGRDVLAFGDVHGEDVLLEALLEEAARVVRGSPDAALVFLGDLVDRGPSSLRCLDLAAGAPEATGARECSWLIGNHEQMLKLALEEGLDPYDRVEAYAVWLGNGGIEVVGRELGIERPDRGAAIGEVRDRLGPRRVALLDAMVPNVRHGDALFVHAGVSPDVPLDAFLATPWTTALNPVFREDLHWAWVREPFHDATPAAGHHGAFVVHGHDPDDGRRPYPDMVARWRLNLDGGTYRTGRARMAWLRDGEATVYEASLLGARG